MASLARIALCAAVLAACKSSSSSLPGPGLDQQVGVRGAQLVKGPIVDPGCDPATSADCGPAVTAVMRNQASVVRGDGTVFLEGRLGEGGTALHVWAEGDPDHWIALPSINDLVVPSELDYSVELEFSFSIQTDTITLDLQAADAKGHLGPVTTTDYTILPDVPPATLEVSLGWDAPADMDLYVELPDGTLVGPKNINANVPSGNPSDPSWMYSGYIDLDSNSECVIDSVQREDFVWLAHTGDPKAVPPPSGHYKVYANLFAPCGASAVSFDTIAQVNGEVVARAASTLYPFDSRTLPGDDQAPGLLMMELDLP